VDLVWCCDLGLRKIKKMVGIVCYQGFWGLGMYVLLWDRVLGESPDCRIDAHVGLFKIVVEWDRGEN
jgi:hypothetical protein